ncbi:MAG: protein kinase [bacterium]
MNDGPLATGEVVDGRYRIDAQVGRGGMGVVYRGTDLTLRRAVAIKVLQARGGSSDTLKRFMREAQALAQVEHRGLVPVYAVGRSGDLYYMVMKFIEGRTLSEIIKAEAPSPPAAGAHPGGCVRGPAGPARRRPGAPRHEARQRDGGGRWPRDGDGSGHRRRGGRGGSVAERHRDAALHGARDAVGRRGGRAGGCLLAGGHRLPRPDGDGALDGPTAMAVLFKHAHEPFQPIRQRAPGCRGGWRRRWSGRWPRSPASASPRRPSWPSRCRRPWAAGAAAAPGDGGADGAGGGGW